MPELPEVETMRRGILSIIGSRIRDVQKPPSRKRPIQIAPAIAALKRRLVGQRISAVERAGKRVVVVFDSENRLVFEPRMTGLVLLADPPSLEHLRLRIRLSGGKHSELLFWDQRGLGIVRLLDPRQFDKLYGAEKLGPDALTLNWGLLAERLGSSHQAIKVALLDQRRIAGIGNLYASEILHLAGIHPRRTCDRLRAEDWQRLNDAVLTVLEKAILFEGSTLADGTYRNALNESGSYQNHHRVYDRKGQLCAGCRKTPIERIVQVGRSTFYCATCQPMKAARRRA